MKDVYFNELQRRISDAEDEGLDFDQAYERAGREAYEALPSIFADAADAYDPEDF
jgi:hypothetical protein